MIEDRCRWVRDPKIGRYLLPGCMGAAVYGPRGCTCAPQSTVDRVEALEQRIAALEARLEGKRA